MSNRTSDPQPIAQAVVSGDLADGTSFSGRAGAIALPVGGPCEFGGNETGPNPYDLLSASLAACTAMTIRRHARHQDYPLQHVEVSVFYHRPDVGEPGVFERSISLEGPLTEEQTAQLLRGADMCPVGRTLSV